MAFPSAGTGGEQDEFWPLPQFYFSVDIGEFSDLAFKEVSGLSVETQAIEYRHGNSSSMSTINMPGIMKSQEVVLKKGVFVTDNNFMDWISEIELNTYERVTVVIKLLNEDGIPVFTWTLRDAFPLKVEPTELDSMSSEVALESITFIHQGVVAKAV